MEYPPFFDRAEPYGEYDDNRLRFAFLARAALEYFRSRGERPGVFHAHDWQTGLVPVYLKAFYWDDPTLQRMPSVFTIHNVAYQGQFGTDTLGAARPALAPRQRLRARVPRRDQLPEGRDGLRGDGEHRLPDVRPRDPGSRARLRLRGGRAVPSRRRVGILNGVDYEEWDPRRTTASPGATRPPTRPARRACKADLLQRVRAARRRPTCRWSGVISRLVWQKGFDIVAEAWWDLLQRPLRMVVLGTGDAAVQDGLAELAAPCPGPLRRSLRLRRRRSLTGSWRAPTCSSCRRGPSRAASPRCTRCATAPSRSCGSTGGLADTVEPYDPTHGSGTGFRFDHADGTGLVWALDQALAAQRDAGGLGEADAERDGQGLLVGALGAGVRGPLPPSHGEGVGGEVVQGQPVDVGVPQARAITCMRWTAARRSVGVFAPTAR